MVSIIIPMYNEEKIIAASMKVLCDSLDGFFKKDYEVICVDDGSTDDTYKTVLLLKEKIPRLKVISYSENRGKGGAVREGILNSSGDVILYTDCDLAYGTEIIEKMVKSLSNGTDDIVIGSRNISKEGYDGYTIIRRIVSKTYIKVITLAAGFHHSDSQCGIKCFKGEVARRVFNYCKINGFAFDLEALMVAEHLGYTVNEYPVKIINHRESTSKVHLFKDTFKMLRDIRGIKRRISHIEV